MALDVNDPRLAGDVGEQTLGQLVSRATADLSTLVRKEIELAKAEVAAEAKKAGKGVGFLGGAGGLAFMGWVVLTFAAVWGLNEALPLWLSALLVGLVYLVLAGILGLLGKKALSRLDPPPRRTISTVKEDVAWVRRRNS